jgi:hypothetical protein
LGSVDRGFCLHRVVIKGLVTVTGNLSRAFQHFWHRAAGVSQSWLRGAISISAIATAVASGISTVAAVSGGSTVPAVSSATSSIAAVSSGVGAIGVLGVLQGRLATVGSSILAISLGAATAIVAGFLRRVQNPQVMFCILLKAFIGDTITGGLGVPRHVGIALEKLAGIAPSFATAGAVRLY